MERMLLISQRVRTLFAWLILAAASCGLAAETASDPKPQPAPRDRIDQLIEQLGDDRFSVREAAQAELAKIGPEAFDALTVAENNPDLEVSSRAHYLLGFIDFDWVRDDDPAEVKLALADYDKLDVDGRRARIQKLAERPTIPQIMALCRLVRFEKSHILSKETALAIMKQGAEPRTEMDKAILDGIASSPRSSAEWLRIYVLSHSKPEDAVAQWNQVIGHEESAAVQSSEQSRPEFVASLLKIEVELLESLGRKDAALVAMRRAVGQETGDTQSLVNLIRWLSQHQADSVLDDVASRFADRFDQDAILTYSLAEARAATGNSDQARQLADRALKLNPGDAGAHVEVAEQLRRRGLIDWSEREFRDVIELGPPESLNTLNAELTLADMLHDQQRDLEAAHLLESSLSSLEKAAKQDNKNDNIDVRRLLEAIRGRTIGRLHYYHACHWNAQGDHQQEREHLEQGFEVIPLDADNTDILIALYRLPDQSPEQRQKTEGRIKTMVRQFRNQVAQNPRDPNAFNQLAWLLSNTDREREEALRCSLESLRLRPNEPGLLDTLGRCYYALGDYENAVKSQSQAVELDETHSGVMRRQLELFKKALADKQAKPAPL